MEKKLTNNLLLKVMSLIAAFLLWIVVINIDNPTDTFTISNIPIKILNEQSALTDNNLTYELAGEQTVSVEVTARRTDRRKISADDFEATIDMSRIYGATGYVEVNVTIVNNKSLIRAWTQITRSVRVNVEELQTKEFDIRVNQKGELADSYTFDEITISPQRVRVTAPESIMEIISYAAVDVDVDGKNDNLESEGEIRLYREDGQAIDLTADERLVMNITSASVSMSVAKTNQISVDVQVTGQDAVASGYKYITYKCEPQTVSVTGAKALIADFDKLTIEEDISGLSGNITRVYKVSDYLPKGLQVAEGQPDTIEIVFQIEKLTRKNFTIGKNQVNLIGAASDLTYQLGDDNVVMVVLEGLEEDLDSVTSRELAVSLDVSEIDEPGTYELVPQVEMAEEYHTYFDVSAPKIRVIVTRPSDATEATENTAPGSSENTGSNDNHETGSTENVSSESKNE